MDLEVILVKRGAIWVWWFRIAEKTELVLVREYGGWKVTEAGKYGRWEAEIL